MQDNESQVSHCWRKENTEREETGACMFTRAHTHKRNKPCHVCTHTHTHISSVALTQREGLREETLEKQ